MRALSSVLTALVLAAGVVVTAPTGSAVSAEPIPVADLGRSSATAAGSCWEIKQARPAEQSGAFWLLTPRMTEPQQFYCDMVTDGGGWVLVGKGRDGWDDLYEGKGDPAQLLSPDLVPMSAQTHQLSAPAVDALLGGGRVDALGDGIRLRRAMDTQGQSWQEVRFKLASRDRWVWTFGAEHPLASYSFGSTTRTGGLTASFGTDSGFNRVDNQVYATNSYKMGFAYGSQVTGSSASTSYLWSATTGGGRAIPYTTVWIRPQVTSTAGFSDLADAGTAAWTRPDVLRSTALASPWGVTGIAGSTAVEGSVEVQAFTQSGDRMYVGGNFRYVQRDAAGTDRVEQPFLAAFDVATGEWVPSFRPVLDEQVRALATLPSGEILAGGDFTRANGAAATAVVALDPDTGATSTTWTARLENRVSGDVLRVNALDVAGPYVYVGGKLTHAVGGSNTTYFRYMRMLARLSSDDGTPSVGWNPGLNGAVKAVDASDDLSRVYAAGYFTATNRYPALKAVALLNTAGAPPANPLWSPTWSASANYQQAIKQVGGSVFVGGSEHSLFQFDTSTFARTSGSIMKRTGDVQAIEISRGAVYAGCHCDQWSYENAFAWPTLTAGWTQADAIGWFGAWDSITGQRIPDFTPTLRMRLNQGIWALKADSNGTMWAGGDVRAVRTPAQQARWSGGFARFPLVDSTAPATPTGLTVAAEDSDSVTLSWSRVFDEGGGVRYQVLRDDRPVAATTDNTGSLTVPKGGDNRFFVRAVDGAGNVSASTSVLRLGQGNLSPTAAFSHSADQLTASFDASGSSDPDGGIVSHDWTFGDGDSASGVTVQHTYAAPGTYPVTLTVTDGAGATATRTEQVSVTLPAGESVVVTRGSEWRWKYDATAPPADWNTTAFDASGWSLGNAVLGFGGPVATDVDTFASTTDRPRTAHFTRTFEIEDAAAVERLVLESVADDGVVIYVNGTEVVRSNMPTGTITHLTFASSARRTSVANADPVVVDVPVSLLVDGTNVVSAETHLNYRATADISFDLEARLTAR